MSADHPTPQPTAPPRSSPRRVRVQLRERIAKALFDFIVATPDATEYDLADAVMDAVEGYCGACHDWTGTPAVQSKGPVPEGSEACAYPPKRAGESEQPYTG